MKRIFSLLLPFSVPLLLLADPAASAHYRQAHKLLESARFREAIYHYRLAIERNPNYKEAHLGRARAYYELGEFNRALAALEPLLKLEENHLPGLLLRGQTHIELGNMQTALLDLNKVRAADPGNQAAYLALGQLYEKSGQEKLALKIYQKVLLRDPANFSAVLGLARHYARSGRTEQALAELEKARRINSVHYKFHEARGEILLHAGLKQKKQELLEDSEQAFRTALDLSPENLALEHKLIRLELLLDENASALERARKLYEAKDMAVLPILAHLQEQQGQNQIALNSYAALLRVNPDDSLNRFAYEELAIRNLPPLHAMRRTLAAYHYSRRNYYRKTDRTDLSILHLQRELQLNPESASMKDLLDEYRRQANHELFLNTLVVMRNKYPDAGTYQFQLESLLNKKKSYLPLSENLLAHPSPLTGIATIRRSLCQVFVADFRPDDPLLAAPGAYAIFPAALGWFIAKTGRIGAPDALARARILDQYRRLKDLQGPVFYSPELDAFLEERSKDIRFIVGGSFREYPGKLRTQIEIYERKSGSRIANFAMEEGGQDALLMLGGRIARELYKLAPLEGNVVKVRAPDAVFINAGAQDGVAKGNIFRVYRNSVLRGRIKILEAATYVSRAEATGMDWTSIHTGDHVAFEKAQ